MTPAAQNFSMVFIELGAATIGLAIVARLASRWGFSAIPVYLLAGVALGKGGVWPLQVSHDFIALGAEIGVLLLLFMLGLEYSGDDLKQSLHGGVPGISIDLLLNFPPGFFAGMLLGWHPMAAVLLGGVTFMSSSGIVARVLGELKRTSFPEVPRVVSILVLEDLVMAVYLPLVTVLLEGGSPVRLATSVAIACVTVAGVLLVAIRYGHTLSNFVGHESDEIVLLTTFGALLLAAGLAQSLRVSAAIAAFLVGIAVSGPMVEQSHRMLAPLRDLFAATFFFFFGLEIDPQTLPPELVIAAALAGVTILTKALTGYLATRRAPRLSARQGFRAGFTLVAHGEFSIVIAGLGVAVEPRLAALSAAYVLLMAIAGPITARLIR
ncbi:MAG: cation:proton antiporter [Acidobacteriota bacterium]